MVADNLSISSSTASSGSFTTTSSRRPSIVVLKFEEILEKLGGFGKFQILILFLLLSLEIPVAFVTFIPIFTQAKGTFSCLQDDESLLDGNSEIDICSCNGTLIALSEESIVSTWTLVCSSAWVADFILSIQLLGMFLGNIYGSQFADWYGRKNAFLLATLILTLGSSVSAIAPNPYVYAAARFFCGAGIPAYINVTCMAVMEFMPPRYRSLSNSVGPTGEGIMILSILAYFFRSWRTLYWITVAPFALIVIIYPLVPESPRWLLRNGKTEEAHKVLKYMAKVNGGSGDEVSLATLKKLSEQEEKERECNSSTKRFGYMDFFKDASLRRTSFHLMAIWFSWSLVYFGISYNIKNVEGNVYLNVFLIGVANSLGQRLAMLINNRLGRRRSLFCSITFCAISLVALAISTLVFPEASVILTVPFCLLATLGMASARSAARLLSGESFPTAVRTMGLGLGGIAANIAGVVTPQLAYIGTSYPSIPYLSFAVVGVCGSLVAFRMKETTGQPLVDNVEGNNTGNDKIDPE